MSCKCHHLVLCLIFLVLTCILWCLCRLPLHHCLGSYQKFLCLCSCNGSVMTASLLSTAVGQASTICIFSSGACAGGCIAVTVMLLPCVFWKKNYQWFVISNYSHVMGWNSNVDISPVHGVCLPSQCCCIWFMHWIGFCWQRLLDIVLYHLVLHCLGIHAFFLPGVAQSPDQHQMHQFLSKADIFHCKMSCMHLCW